MIRGLRSIGYALAQAALAARCPACDRPSRHQLAGVCLACWDDVDADRFQPRRRPIVTKTGARWRRSAPTGEVAARGAMLQVLGASGAGAAARRKAGGRSGGVHHGRRRAGAAALEPPVASRIQPGRSAGPGGRAVDPLPPPTGTPCGARAARRPSGATRVRACPQRAGAFRGASRAAGGRPRAARGRCGDDQRHPHGVRAGPGGAGAIEVRAAAVARTMTRSDS